MLAQTFSRFFIVVDYEINKEYIAKNLCENKDKPALKCHGKCQMMKQLKQEEQKDQQNPERKMENKFEVISFQPTTLHIAPFYTVGTNHFFETRECISPVYLAAPFHPPRLFYV